MKAVLALLAVVSLASADYQCTNLNIGAYTATCDNHFFDFSCIFGNATFTGSDSQYRYLFSLANNGVNTPLCKAPLAADSAVVQISDVGCYSLGNVNSQSWSVAFNTNVPTVSITLAGGDDGRTTTVRVTCDPNALKPIFKVRGEVSPLIYEMDIASNAACTTYVPNCKPVSYAGPAITQCTRLGVPMPDGSIYPTSGYMLDGIYEPMSDTTATLTRTDYTSCSQTTVLFQLVTTLAVQRNASVMSWKPQGFTVYIHSNLSSLITALNSQCPCGGSFYQNSYRDIDPSKCPPLPAPKASWLCWMFAQTTFYTSYQNYQGIGFSRTMLNTSITGNHNPPVDSPPLVNLPIGKVGNADLCDFERWSNCGDIVMRAVPQCNYEHNVPLRDMCMMQTFMVDGQSQLEYCCPCLAKYATSYNYPWANIRCALN